MPPPRGSIHVYFHNTRNIFFLRNRLANQSQISCEASIRWGNQCVYKNLGHMAAMPIYGKTPSKIVFSGTGGLISKKFGMKH